MGQEAATGFDLAISDLDVLHSHLAAVVPEFRVRLAVFLIVIDVVQNIFEMTFRMSAVFAHLIVEAKDAVSLVPRLFVLVFPVVIVEVSVAYEASTMNCWPG